MDMSTSPQCKGVLYGGQERRVTAATTMGSVRLAGLLLLLSFLLYVADSYTNIDVPNMGCDECTLRKKTFLNRAVYQCMGCCFSRAYPTPLMAARTMATPKNITSEATCCIAKRSYETEVASRKVRNHTDCHCSTCYYQKI